MLKQLSKFPLIKYLPLQRLHSAGLEGFLMLVFSNMLIVASLGFSLLYDIYYVTRIAIRSSSDVVPDTWVMLLGLKLHADKPTTDFIVRMDRAVSLYKKFPQIRILALGGMTGSNTLTEAEVANEYFIAAGIDENRIIPEQESTHTLENLQFARKLVTDNDSGNIVLISNRYHLARCEAMVTYMGLPHKLCAAEECFDFSFHNVLLIIKEAYHLHWYKSGQWWARLSKNKKLLSRIQ